MHVQQSIDFSPIVLTIFKDTKLMVCVASPPGGGVGGGGGDLEVVGGGVGDGVTPGEQILHRRLHRVLSR